MKNLKVVTEVSLQLDLLSEGENILLSSYDIERNRVFFASSSNLIYTIPLPSSQQGTEWSQSLTTSEAELVDLEPGDCIAAMDYLMEKEALIIGSTNGCLLLYNVDEKSVETVGRVEGGVDSIASSPDGALLSVTTGLGQLLVMTHDWEVLYENSLDQQAPENDVPSDVDFTGRQSQTYPITWRGDGKYFATLGVPCNSSCMQKLIVWERDSGTLHSSSQPKAFMQGSIDWMLSGAKIASACDRKAEGKPPLVVFFERNGLERNSFSLDELVESTVETIKWNCNSELLATCVACSEYDAVKIWYFSNNHWYLKQEMRFPKEDRVRFLWDPTKPLSLVSWTVSGRVVSYKFAWFSAVAETSTSLVVDGSSVLVTPLTISLMPPPMFLFNFKFHASVRDLSFLSNNVKNLLAAYLCDGSLCVVELPETNEWDQFEGNEFTVENCLLDLKPDNLLHLSWLDTHTLLGVSSSSLQEIEVACSENSLPGGVCLSGWHAKLTKKTSIENPAVSVVSNPAKVGSAFVQINGGAVLEYPSNNFNRSTNTNFSLPFTCPWMRSALCNENGIFRILLLGLDETGRLHYGKKTICTNCTSFSFYRGGHSDQAATHLLFTTKQDILFIVEINEILNGDLELKLESYNTKSYKGKEGRDHVILWERGAKLIGVLHGDEAGAIMQTNRGNLECIYPRKLVLSSIVNALSQRRFRDAITMVRRHRIDFNVIVDYCGLKSFVKSASDFVTQVNNLGHITEFVCSVKKENVIDKLYKAYISLSCGDESSENKVTSVLTAVRKALEEKIPESPSRELCILTTLARSEPPLLEEALKRIKLVRELELVRVDDAKRQTYPSAEEALKHLLWLTDPESVFNAALGLYDLNLAAIVALNSQKDPKEFIPYLKGLEQLSPAVMRYTIDLKLGRNESALKNIFSAGDMYWDDFTKLLNANPSLFPFALQMITNPDKKREVLEAWGDYLYEEKLFEEAATTYLCCNLYNKSMKAYRGCGDWRGVFTVAGLMQLQKPQVVSLASELCEEFQAMGKPGEAARVSLEYCNDVEKGVGYYIMAREWEEALRIAYMHEKEELVRDVREAALECGSSLVSEYEEGSVKLGKYVARYLAVRQRRLVLAAKIRSEEDGLVNGGDDDVASEISTTFSEMSAYTTSRSLKDSGSSVTTSTASKARGGRRQKKGGKIRAGSPGEELALVEHLRGMALASGAQREIKSLVVVLLSLGKYDIARQVQNCVDNFEVTQKAAVKLAEDTIGNEIIDEAAHTLENYVKILRALPRHDISWHTKVLMPPQ
ncbi:Elongator complex protein 1 [Rhynchospora pubera]|uniref:Elongator complex protein 1 n=1 Tax=Rhynchospora pubera TaxID=906938 RepID=A0AAV8FPL1_9POAL|nr:Elongator complex protein 1 [Rhynchospora pubera]